MTREAKVGPLGNNSHGHKTKHQDKNKFNAIILDRFKTIHSQGFNSHLQYLLISFIYLTYLLLNSTLDILLAENVNGRTKSIECWWTMNRFFLHRQRQRAPFHHFPRLIFCQMSLTSHANYGYSNRQDLTRFQDFKCDS